VILWVLIIPVPPFA
jgi:micrococcal nuclease